MWLRLCMLVVWAGVAGSVVFWGTRLLARPMPVPAHASVAVAAATTGADLSGLLGAGPAPQPAALAPAPVQPAEASRFQLLGVVAARHAERSQGVALIAVDGKIPRAYRVGAIVDGALVLQAVQARAAQIGPKGAAAVVSLELPTLPPPATGIPGAVSGGSPGVAAGAVPPAARPTPPAFGAIQGVRPPQLAMPAPGATPGFGGLMPGRARNLGVPAAPVQGMPQAATETETETVPPDAESPAPTSVRRNLR